MSSTAFGTQATALNVSRVRGTWLVVTALVLMTPLLSDAQSPPMTYGAIYRTVRPYPPLPSLGGAGFRFTDPAFGSKMLRVTDQNTRPDRPGRAFFSPASAETNAWNIDSTKFFVTGEGGEMIPFSFNPTTMVASRMGNTSNGTGGLLLNVDGEPEFSYVDPDVIYGQSGSQIVSYRFSTGARRPYPEMRLSARTIFPPGRIPPAAHTLPVALSPSPPGIRRSPSPPPWKGR